MEKRMYFFVPYQLTGIQQGIQCGHAALEYSKTYRDDEDYIDFIDNWKTWVILNGGTTNINVEHLGTLNAMYNSLIENDINCEAFYEPDLGDQMTAICFICDDRVFNKEKYPDYVEYESDYIDWSSSYYNEWLEAIGGDKNLFLRELLSGKKLA
jgi:hypothetical protein